MTVGELKMILLDVADDTDVVCSNNDDDTFEVTQVIRVKGLFGTSADNLIMSTD